MANELTIRDKAILDMEGRTFKNIGTKTAVVKDELDMTLNRYTLNLNTALNHPDAAAYAPATVSRLIASRDNRLPTYWRRLSA